MAETQGLQLAKYYHTRQFQVRIIDFKTSSHLEHNHRCPYAESLVGNLCDLDFCKFVLRGAEIVKHTAIRNLLYSACHAGVKAFLYTSPYADAPEPQSGLQSFASDPPHTGSGTRPNRLSYLDTLHLENVALHYSDRMIVRIARLGEIYGPGDPWIGVENDCSATLIRKALVAKQLSFSEARPSIELVGEPNHKRHLSYADEIVKELIELLKGEESKGPHIVQPGEPISNLELAKIALEVVGLDPSSAEIIHANASININEHLPITNKV
ncbi:unnamed protein product [Rhizoctonia solani]|uniref:NAD-dependent epimerase/dehydratase domain-containing protein n=1 Tax=Rhizoctonia solani TaxID=456999 RepID=A0A8H2XZE1_9AGAM|nr:unnamed protein product [Rhizoctonia solani]